MNESIKCSKPQINTVCPCQIGLDHYYGEAYIRGLNELRELFDMAWATSKQFAGTDPTSVVLFTAVVQDILKAAKLRLVDK